MTQAADALMSIFGFKRVKGRKCKTKGCENIFVPYHYTLQNLCVDCLVKKGRKIAERSAKAKEKAERQQVRERKAKLKTRSDWIREVQTLVNRWIRMRDAGLGCISCGTHNGKMNAGHFLSTGARPDLRFDVMNINTQCERCNSYLSGNQAAYRIALIAKIGLAEVDRLEGPATLKQLPIDELKAIKAKYAAKLKEMK